MARVQSETEAQNNFNQAARNWTRRRAYQARRNARVAFLRGKAEQPRIFPSQQKEPHLARSISYKLKKDYGLVQRISFKFPRHGIYQEMGVGRSYKAQAGGGGGGRKRVRWLSQEIDDHLPELADALGEQTAHALTREARDMLRPRLKRR